MYQQFMHQAYSSLATLTTEDLRDLLNDDDKLEERVIQSIASLESEKEVALSENSSLAEQNLAREPEIIEFRSRINDLSEEGKTLCESVKEKLSQIKSKTGDLSQDTALALLQTAAAESEESSDDMVKQLMSADMTVDSFLEQFMALRKTMHLRKLKVEKMIEVIRQPPVSRGLNSGGGGGGVYPSPNNMFGQINLPYPGQGGSSVPYPLGPMQMPMPGMFHQY